MILRSLCHLYVGYKTISRATAEYVRGVHAIYIVCMEADCMPWETEKIADLVREKTGMEMVDVEYDEVGGVSSHIFDKKPIKKRMN